jgi:hypothetical protein
VSIVPDDGNSNYLQVSGGATFDQNVTAASFNATSDKRLKSNIEPLQSQWNNIKMLQPSSYTWKHNSKPDCGFIAQDIYKVFTNLIPDNLNIDTSTSDSEAPTDKNGKPIYYSIDYGKITPYLCKGLQEAILEIEKMKQEIDTLKRQIESISQTATNTPSANM